MYKLGDRVIYGGSIATVALVGTVYRHGEAVPEVGLRCPDFFPHIVKVPLHKIGPRL